MVCRFLIFYLNKKVICYKTGVNDIFYVIVAFVKY